MLSMLPHQFVEEANLSTSCDQQDTLKHRLSAILKRRLERPPLRSLKPKVYQTVQHHLVMLSEDIWILQTQIRLHEAESTQRSQLFHGDNAVKSDPSLTLLLPKPLPSKPTTSSTSRWLKTISSHSSTVQNFQTAYGLMSSQTTSSTLTKSMPVITPSSLITNLQKLSEMLTSLSWLGEEQANHQKVLKLMENGPLPLQLPNEQSCMSILTRQKSLPGMRNTSSDSLLQCDPLLYPPKSLTSTKPSKCTLWRTTSSLSTPLLTLQTFQLLR